MANQHTSLQDDPTGLTITACLQDAEAFKSEGNDYFRARKWDEALVAYRTGLARLPKRKPKIATNDAFNEDAEEAQSDQEEAADVTQGAGDDIPEPPGEYTKARAVLNANIGACYVKLGDHKQAVDACTQALLDDPNYIKALQRRAASNEQIDSWSSLTAAQDDYTTLLGLLPSSSPQMKELERMLRSLKPRIEAAQKRDMAEMMGKLKGLGNSILGNFGLSTDNFKFEPNGQGGYSMNFTQ